MEYNHDKVDEVVLALLTLTMFSEGEGTRAWKGQAWEVMDRLFEQGWISDPKSKAKAVWLTDTGRVRAEQLFSKHFAE